MTRRTAILLLAPLLLLSISATAKAADAQAEAYLQAIIKANQTLKQAGFEAGKQFGPILSGQEPDAAKLKTAVAQATQTLTKVSADMKQAVAPNSPEGQALAAAHAKFLEGQQQIISGEFVELMKVAIDKSIPIAERKTKLTQGLDKVTAVEQKSLPPLAEAFGAYIQKYEIKIQ